MGYALRILSCATERGSSLDSTKRVLQSGIGVIVSRTLEI